MAKHPKIKNLPPAPPALRLVEEPIAGTPYFFLVPAAGVTAKNLTVDERIAMATRITSLKGKVPKFAPRPVNKNSSIPAEMRERMEVAGNGALEVIARHANDKPETAPVAASSTKAPSKAPKLGTKRGKAAEFIAKHKHDGSVAAIADLAKELAELIDVPLSTAGKWIKNGNTQ